jgi:hypothetical protein
MKNDARKKPEKEKAVIPGHIDQAPPPTEKDIPPEAEEQEHQLLNQAGEVINGDDEVPGPAPETDKPEKIEVKPIELYFPTMYPLGGRIITIGVMLREQKTKGGLYIVPKGITRDNYDRLRSNPNEDMLYFVVDMCPTVNKALNANGMLPKRYNSRLQLEVGDQIVVSPNMEPVYYREVDPNGLREFWIWHHSDILGFRKDPGNIQRYDEAFGPKTKPVKEIRKIR